MNIKEMESTTLSAINKLTELEFPFAAAILCYVMVERCLKLYLLQNRNTLTASDIDICVGVGKGRTLRFRDYASNDEPAFVGNFLNEIQLGGLEIIFRIQNQGIANDRNELIHSGFYLDIEKNMSFDNRQEQNWNHYITAAKHLHFCSTNCFYIPISFDESSKILTFES